MDRTPECFSCVDAKMRRGAFSVVCQVESGAMKECNVGVSSVGVAKNLGELALCFLYFIYETTKQRPGEIGRAHV